MKQNKNRKQQKVGNDKKQTQRSKTAGIMKAGKLTNPRQHSRKYIYTYACAHTPVYIYIIYM